MRLQSRQRINWGIYTMQNYVYGHMARDVESDLVAYIMGLWHMEKMRKQSQNYNGAIKLKATAKDENKGKLI
jgi:O-antigen ligase